MKPTGVSRPVRLGSHAHKTWESVIHGKSVPSCDAVVTCVLPVLCVFLQFLAHCSMNPYVYPTGFVRCHFGCSVGLCRCRTGFGTPYGQSCRTLWGKYRACRTHRYGRLSDHAWLCSSPKSSEAHLWKLYSHGQYGPVRVQNPRKIVQTGSAVIHPV